MPRPQSFKESIPGLWRVLRHFWPETRKHYWLILGSSLALLGEVLFRLLEPWPLKVVFDRVIHRMHGADGYRVTFLDIFDPVTLLTAMAVLTVLLTALRAVAGYWNTVGFAKIGTRVLAKVRAQLYRHLQYLSLSFHAKARAGDLVVRVINDISLLQDVVVTAVLPMLGKTLSLAGMIGLMFWLNWRLALAALAVFPLFWLRTVSMGRKINEVARLQRKREGAMAATASETINAIKTVQALSLETAFEQQFSRQNEKNLKQDVKARRLAAGLERSVDLLTAVSGALVLYYGTRLVLRGELTAGSLLVFLAYLKNAFRPIQEFAKYTARLSKAAAGGERVLDVLQHVPDVRDLPGAVQAPPFRGEVRFENVSFAYESNLDALTDVNFEVRPGQTVALVGRSGSGKSTLVSLLLRLYDPRQGRVLMDGHDLREFTVESLRSQISAVLQDNLLFAASVRENIAHGSPDAAPEAVIAAARLANAHDFIQALPEGYGTVLGERGVTLSQGQRQRLAIARAAIRKAPILILDEPMTGLDKHNEQAVLQSLARLDYGCTTFLVTHDLRHAAGADLILVLDSGRIVERGTHRQLLRANGRYAALYRLQVGGHTAAADATLEAVAGSVQ
ncbi:MAG: ABC transporter ATP-binding protein [Verrucomicrobiota bacterium]|nr:ABC transporter ATP-binding protein [Verrucomicrobiota bacterium]